MSQENVEVVRAMIEVFRNRDRAADPGFGTGDAVAVAGAVHPEIEWDTTSLPVDDLRGVYHGLRGLAEFWQRWLEAWDTIEFDEPELIDAGDYVVYWIERLRMRGKSSGIEVDTPPFGMVFRFHDGKITRVVHYLDRREALEAAGLSE